MGYNDMMDEILRLKAQRDAALDACELVLARLERTVQTYNGDASLADTGEWDEELEYLRHAIGMAKGVGV